jgi:hypothetical protein
VIADGPAAMDSHQDLSLQILNNQNIMKKLLGELVPLVYRHFNAKPALTTDDLSGSGTVSQHLVSKKPFLPAATPEFSPEPVTVLPRDSCRVRGAMPAA